VNELAWMTSSPWAAVCAVLTLLLGAYSLVYWSAALAFLFRRRQEPPEGTPTGAVTILIPARNEGPCAVRAVRSARAQDHAGPVHIQLLLKDRDDTSLPFLKQAWPFADFDADPIQLEGHTHVVFTGHDPKHAKVNAAVETLQTPHVAILDCDHQADPEWIRTSLALSEATGSRVIQGRRAPLTAGGFFPLWDSLHQHVGCELFNAAFDRMDLTVFVTGTTVVMDTELLRDRPLRDCITEDIDFSYGVVLEGERIRPNPHAGSSEEVSPDLYSFVARRRRWANGHTDAFFRHLPKLWGSSLTLRQRIQFLLHGVHYMVCAAVFVLHLAIGLWFLPELSGPSSGAAAAVGLGLAIAVASTQRTRGLGSRLGELLIGFLWFTPAVVIAMNLLLAFGLGDIGKASLPLPGALQLLGVAGFGAPLVVLLLGMIGFRQLTPTSALAVILTYPVAFYVDVCAVLVGLGDRLWGRSVWRAVARAEHDDVGPVVLATPRSIAQSWSPSVVLPELGQAIPRLMKPSRSVPALLLVALFAAGVLYAPASRLPVADAGCTVLEHDGDPWIVPAAKLEGYCQPEHGERWSSRTGTFDVQRSDTFTSVDSGFWDTLDSTFFCNQAHFQPANVVLMDGSGVAFHLKEEKRGDREYTAGNIATKDVPEAHYLYGRFETVMKPAKGAGTLTAFFLYRFDPWQEIDAEFVGRDTRKLLINVFYNPGDEGDLYNYGYRGTPVLVDLGFDASEDFHTYAIEWDPDEIRWFVDGEVVHRRRAGSPTPIPHLPMRFHANLWPTCSEELAGALDVSALPSTAEVKSITISTWTPPPRNGLMAMLQRVLPERGRNGGWRERASWIQPGR
jgi:beta-glucanase (GH16 family)